MTGKENDISLPISARIKMGRREFCAVMFKLWGGKAVTILSLLLAVSLVLGIWLDLRFFIITLMVIFIVSPMILGFMYYYYGLGERCYFNVTKHAVEFSEQGIKISMYFPEVAEPDSEETERSEKCVVKNISYAFLHRYNVRRNSVIFPVGQKRIDGFIWLPETAFDSSEEFVSAVKFLSKHSPEGAN